MIFTLDSNHLIHQLWHMGRTKARKETGDEDAIPDLADVLDWFLIRLDNLRDYMHQLGDRHGCERVVLVAAFDSSRKTFRSELLPEYKAQRTRIAEVYQAVSDAKEALVNSDEWLGLVSPDGFEADDLIASIAHQAKEEVVIHSADKDLNQCLVADRVGIIKRSGMEEMDFNIHGIALGAELKAVHYTDGDFWEEYGFSPDRFVEYQCLVGDSADNVKGCSWVGPIMAKWILQHYRTKFENLDPDYLPLNKRQRKAWDPFIEDLPRLRQVFTLNTQLQIPDQVRINNGNGQREVHHGL